VRAKHLDVFFDFLILSISGLFTCFANMSFFQKSKLCKLKWWNMYGSIFHISKNPDRGESRFFSNMSIIYIKKGRPQMMSKFARMTKNIGPGRAQTSRSSMEPPPVLWPPGP